MSKIKRQLRAKRIKQKANYEKAYGICQRMPHRWKYMEHGKPSIFDFWGNQYG